jgi:G3E family GTPase
MAFVFEASGVADPAGIARTFASTSFRTAVRDLVFGQIGYSDLVVLNKIDLADRSRVDDVRHFMLDRPPTVRIIETTRCQVPSTSCSARGRPTRPRQSWSGLTTTTRHHDDPDHR